MGSSFLLTLTFLAVSSVRAQSSAEPSEIKPVPSQSLVSEEKIDFKKVITDIPETSLLGLKMSFTKESLPYWGAILGSTWILYNNDEVILRDWQKAGRDMGIGNDDNTHPVITMGDIDILRLPTDKGSLLYFLGDGWTHGTIAMGFLLNGYANDNNRAYNTGLKLAHGMAVSTIFSQVLKRAFGRESPYVRTEYQGKWRPFPSLAAYQNKTPQYDAMPSGHIMTATLTFTIVNDSYPEYSSFVVPIGVTWVSLLGFQMVNNGVHWASDYPLGIAMGYVFAKASSQLGKKPVDASGKVQEQSWMLLPASTPSGEGITWLYNY